MKTRTVDPADLSRSAFAVPPLARNGEQAAMRAAARALLACDAAPR